MGTLQYGTRGVSIHFPDRALYHLQIVITAKLRRGESFIFSWLDGPDASSARGTVWLDSSSTIHYRFAGNRVPSVNPAWVASLMSLANGPGGLIFTAEPAQHAVSD